MKICLRCNRTYSDNQKFCSECGEDLKELNNGQMQCYNCLTPVPHDARFCPNCGVEFATESVEEIYDEYQEEEEEEEESWWSRTKKYFYSGLIIIGLIILLATNPSASEHHRVIQQYEKEAYVDLLMENKTLSIPQIRALNSIKYHSAFLFSWTSYKYRGSTHISSIGICGTVLVTFKIM